MQCHHEVHRLGFQFSSKWFFLICFAIQLFLTKEFAEDDFWKESLSTELDDIRKICHGLEKELESSNHLLELSKQQYDNLDREFKLIKDERDSLRKMVSECVKNVELEKDQKENALKELNTEVQRRRDIEEGIKRFSTAFASRHKSFMSFNSELRSKTEDLRTQNPKYFGGWIGHLCSNYFEFLLVCGLYYVLCNYVCSISSPNWTLGWNDDTALPE